MAIVRKTNSILIKVTEVILVLLMTLMVVSMFLQIVGRWIGVNMVWSEEMTRFANAWMVFLGSSIIAYFDDHIAVTVLDDVLKGKSYTILRIARKLIFIVFSVVVFVYGWQTTARVAAQTSPNMGIPMSWVYSAIPVGSFMSFYYLVVSFFAPPPAKSGKEDMPRD